MDGGEHSLRAWSNPAFRATLAVVMRLHLRGWLGVRSRLILGVLFYGLFELILRSSPRLGGGMTLPELCIHFGTMFLVFPLVVVMGTLVHEKANRQLGLLCMTALTAPDILLLKAVPWVLETWLLLALTLPAALLMMVLRGVTGMQILVIYPGLAAWILLAAGCGMLVGACMLRPRSRSWQWLALRILFAVAAVISVPGTAHLRHWQTLDGVDLWLAGCTPFRGFVSLLDPGRCWVGAVAIPLVAVLAHVCFRMAVRCFPTDELDEAMPNAGTNPIGNQAPAPGDGYWPQRNPRTRPGPGLAAITWREFHGPMAGGRSTWLAVVVAVAGSGAMSAWFVWLNPALSFLRLWNVTLAAFAALIVSLLIFVYHISLIGAELRMGTADLLFTLPLEPSGIIWAKRRALAYTLAPVLVTAVIACLALPWHALPIAGEVAFLSALALIAGIGGLAQVSLLLSLWAPKSAVAYTMLFFYAFAIITVGLVVRFPGLQTGPGLLLVLAALLAENFALQVAVQRTLQRLSR
jgi:hypothetical protein